MGCSPGQAGNETFQPIERLGEPGHDLAQAEPAAGGGVHPAEHGIDEPGDDRGAEPLGDQGAQGHVRARLPRERQIRLARGDFPLGGAEHLRQGVDVPGPSLSLVVIDRIPFPRPDDPVAQARTDAVVDSSRTGGAASRPGPRVLARARSRNSRVPEPSSRVTNGVRARSAAVTGRRSLVHG